MEILRGGGVGFQYMVATMSQCTCTTDKEATCIVHPTIRSLKERIADCEAIMASQRFRIDALQNELSDSWRPIETAPRDSRILLKGAHGDVADGWWVGSGWSWPYIHKEPLYWRALLESEK